jgi:hypothetical protein
MLSGPSLCHLLRSKGFEIVDITVAIPVGDVRLITSFVLGRYRREGRAVMAAGVRNAARMRSNSLDEDARLR